MSLFCSLMFNVIGIPSLHDHVLSSVQKPILVYSHYKYTIKTVKVERQEWMGGGGGNRKLENFAPVVLGESKSFLTATFLGHLFAFLSSCPKPPYSSAE